MGNAHASTHHRCTLHIEVRSEADTRVCTSDMRCRARAGYYILGYKIYCAYQITGLSNNKQNQQARFAEELCTLSVCIRQHPISANLGRGEYHCKQHGNAHMFSECTKTQNSPASCTSRQDNGSAKLGTHMPSPLLQNGFLEDILTLPSLNHAVDLLLAGFLSSDSVYSPLHHLPSRPPTMSQRTSTL